MIKQSCERDVARSITRPIDEWIYTRINNSIHRSGSDIDRDEATTYTWPGSNWRPSACEADVIATRPQVLRDRSIDQSLERDIARSITRPIDEWIFTRIDNSIHRSGSDIDRDEATTYTWPGSNWRPSACEADVMATRPQVLRNISIDGSVD